MANQSKSKKSRKSWKTRESRDQRKDYDKRKQNADMQADDNSDKVSGRNDPTWYHHNDQLVKDAGRFSFNRAIGAPTDISKFKLNTPAGDIAIQESAKTLANINAQPSNKFRTPGILVLPFTIAYGRTYGDGTDPINMAAFSIYSNIRQKNSGSANYDAPDLMMYLMAMDSMYTYYMHLVRIYGIMNISNPVNRYLPRYLVEALGMDYDDLSQNLSDFRAYLNMFAVRMNAFCVPKVMDVYKRHTQMAGNLYTDAPSVKAQFYAFAPKFVYKYVERTDEGVPAHLQPIEVVHWFDSTTHLPNLNKFSDVVSTINDVLSGVVNNESFNIMSGDILKAYGMENCFQISMVADSYVTLPIYDQLINQQIRNATVFDAVGFSSIGDSRNYPLYENENGFLASTIEIQDKSMGNMGNHIIACDSDIPTEDDVFEVTRLTVACEPRWGFEYDANQQWVPMQIISCGSEILSDGMECHLNGDGVLVCYSYATAPLAKNFTDAVTASFRSYNYNYHPITYLGYVNKSGLIDYLRDDIKYAILGEFNNYTIMEDDDLRAIHDVAMLSLFGVA